MDVLKMDESIKYNDIILLGGVTSKKWNAYFERMCLCESCDKEVQNKSVFSTFMIDCEMQGQLKESGIRNIDICTRALTCSLV